MQAKSVKLNASEYIRRFKKSHRTLQPISPGRFLFSALIQ